MMGIWDVQSANRDTIEGILYGNYPAWNLENAEARAGPS